MQPCSARVGYSLAFIAVPELSFLLQIRPLSGREGVP
jgi:hypothetical protein